MIPRRPNEVATPLARGEGRRKNPAPIGTGLALHHAFSQSP